MIDELCPHCGQSMQQFRVGVRLTRMQAAIFDCIKRAGEFGITSEEIMSYVYEGREKPRCQAVKSHVWLINSMLVETDYVIRSDRRRWRLEHRPDWRKLAG